MTEIILFLAFLVAAVPVAAEEPGVDPAPVPTLTTGKADYAPGEVVDIHGAGFLPGVTYAIPVMRPDGSIVIIDPVTHELTPGFALINTGPDGAFFYEYQLNGIVGTYEARVYPPDWYYDWSLPPLASVTFTDGALDWNQCQNDSDNNGVQDDCEWTTGALGSNNSIYTEGEVVPHRQIRIIDTAGSHHVTIDHSFYDSSKDAYTYDFFASPDATLDDYLAACEDLPTGGEWNTIGLTRESCTAMVASKIVEPLPTESQYVVGGTGYTYPFVAAAEADAAIDDVDRNLWLACAVNTGTAKNPVLTPVDCTDVQLQILGHAASNGVLLDDQEGPPTSDDFVQMKVSFVTPQPDTLVAIWVGAHLAKQFYWNSPTMVTDPAFMGFGAATAAGASFHVRLEDWDEPNAIGNRDNQMQTGAVVPPAIKTGIKWDDLNGNGIKETVEPVLAGWTIFVDYDNDGVLDEGLEPYAVTDADGFYQIELIRNGTWKVREVQQEGWTCTFPTTADEFGCFHQEAFLGGNTYPDNNFGNYMPRQLTISKTADTSLTRTYSWTIDKQADGEYWKFIGDPATSHGYTVKVDKTVTNSAWAVSGKITVKNDSAMAATITDVSDVVSSDIAAVVTCGVTFPYTLAAGAALECSYSADLPDATARTNTVTVTTSGPVQGGTATAPVSFTGATITEAGYTSVNVTDTNGQSWGPVSDDASWPYTKDFSCPTDLSLYTDGVYTPADAVNTATISETGQLDTATVKLHCYAPVVSKGAVGAYTRTYDWTISKGPDGEYDRFAGESVTHDYTVSVDQTKTDTPYLVTGEITVTNPNPKAAVQVAVADTIPGATSVTLTCGGSLTVPAGGSNTCGYTATLPSATSGTNTATVTLNAIGVSATKDFTFTETTVGSSSISVTDTNGKTWTASGDDAWTYDKTFTCPSDPALYAGDGVYDIVHPNTASIDGMAGKSDDATVTVHCYAPVVSKTAAGAYDEVHEWTVDKKAADPQKKFAGDSASYDWRVTVDETVHNEGFVVKGEITVVNPAPMEMTVALSDMLGDGTVGTLGACTGATLTGSILVVPAGGTARCGYSVSPSSKVAVTNWAKAVLNDIAFETSAEFTWTANPVDPTVSLDDTQNPAWPITVSDDQTFTYTDPQGYTCPTDPVEYAGDGTAPVYTDSNTATITYTSGSQSDTDSTSVTCYGPVVSKDAATEWMKRYDWTITKTADPTTHSGFAGDSFMSNFDVFVDQEITDYGFVASGTITIVNPAESPGSMTLGVTDFLSGGVGASVDCDAVTEGLQASVLVPAGETRTCSYKASLPDNTSRVNTATGTFNSIQFPATANVVFGAPIIEGYPTINVTDSVQGALGSASEDKSFTYTRDFSCSANPMDYTSYADSDTYPNLATIDETGLSDDASVTVDCYVPEVSKTAAGSYGERHEWDVEKTVTPETQSAFAGATVGYEWKVVVTEEVFEEGFAVAGTITVVNHSPDDAMTVDVYDKVNGTSATISSCTGDDDLADGLTIAKGGTSVCSYSAALTYTKVGDAPTVNTAIVVLNELPYTASDPIEWTPAVTRGSATVTDEQIGLDETITEGDTFNGSESYTCSTKPSDYAGDGAYTFSEDNTAIVTSGGAEEDRDSATETIDCYGPVVSKTAAGTYDERHEWQVDKTVEPVSQSGFAGDYLSFEWTIDVVESVFEENFDVAGTITVQNPAPMSMTVALADVLSDSTAVVVGACTNGATYAEGMLTIPAGTTTACGYAASDLDYEDEMAAPTGNTATATLNGIAFVATDPIEWASNVIRGEAVLTDQQGSLSETITGSGTWPIVDSYTCSEDTTKYTENFSYSETTWNTATVTSGTYEKSSTASTKVTCFVPEVSKTAAGVYDERHEWNVTKTVSPVSQSAFAGGTVDYEWTVTVTEETFEENFVASGRITVVNHNLEDAMSVTVDDMLSDGTVATITGCTGDSDLSDGLTIPAGGVSVCDYTAKLTYSDVGLAPKLNTVEVDLNAVDFFASDEIEWTRTVIRGSAELTDLQNPAFPLSISEGSTWTYPEQYTCSTDPSEYDDGSYGWGEKNTATVTSGDQSTSADAETSITCYSPVVTKTADTYFNRDWDWTIEKVSDGSYDLFAGETVLHPYTVTVDPTYADDGWGVKGTITINNPHPTADMVLTSVSDVAGGISGAVTCPSLTVPAGGSRTCTYDTGPQTAPNANPFGDLNTATAVFGGADWEGYALIKFSSTPTTEDEPIITVDDSNLGGESWSADRAGGEWTYTKSFSCSTESGAYDRNGTYSYTDTNTARINEITDTYDTATVKVTCHAPVVTKDAKTYFNRDWDWKIVKEFDGSYHLFAGDTVIHGYQVDVDPTSTDDGWGVKGTITVFNSHPTKAMTLTSLTDLAGGIDAIVTCDNLTVPAGESLTCTYDTGAQASPDDNPFGGTNTATAGFAGANWTGSAPIVFSPDPTTEDEPVITVDDSNLVDEGWSADRASAQWIYSKSFGCSTEPAAYTDGTYTYTDTNTATITETGQKDTATVDVTCHWPTVNIAKTGSTLSKIGDPVTYDIAVMNTTPVEAELRPLACVVSDPLAGFVSDPFELASGEGKTFTVEMNVPGGAPDPFVNTATVTCVPVGASLPIIGSTTEGVYSASADTNLFQPAVEVVKSGPATAVTGEVITYSFTINNLSSDDSPNLMLDSLSDNVLPDDLKAKAMAAGCNDLVWNGSCTFTVDYTVPALSTVPMSITNIVTLHMHPEDFTNDITDTDKHTVVIAPEVQLTDTSYCPLPNNQFRLLYRMESSSTWLLNGSNPGQYYLNGFYLGAPGSDFTMTLQVAYPFVTQEGAGVPIQVHDGTGVTPGGCYAPYPMLSGYTITTRAMTPTSSSGNQIVTPEDYTTKTLGPSTPVTVSGKVPASGLVYVTIHLDYGLKKTGGWKAPGTTTVNPVNVKAYPDVVNQTGFGSGPVTIKGYQPYTFSRTVGSDTAFATPSSYNELKKFAGFIGEVFTTATEDPVANAKVQIYDPKRVLVGTVYTDEDGYYLFPYKHTAKAATYTVKMPNYGRSVSVLVKANGFAAVDFEV